MYVYEKRLQCPVNIKIRNPQTAQFILSQYGGPDGEASAAFRYMLRNSLLKILELQDF